MGVELPWNNDDLILYHGCSELSLKANKANGIEPNAKSHGIDPALGLKNRDFGRGFYTTTSYVQATSWANLRASVLSRKKKSTVRAVVLQFAVKRNDLAELEALVFSSERGPYRSFVKYCREGGVPHARTGCPLPLYDVVYGPVSVALQGMVIKDSDQVSFHTSKAVLKIPSVTVFAKGNPVLEVNYDQY